MFGSRARDDYTPASDSDIAVFSNHMEHPEQAKFLNDIDNIKTLRKKNNKNNRVLKILYTVYFFKMYFFHTGIKTATHISI